MLQFARLMGAFTVAGLLVACAGAGPESSALDEVTRGSVKIDAVVVDVSDLGPTTQGRQVSTRSVKQVLENEANALLGTGAGPLPVRVVIDLQSVNLISAGQSIMIGGESVMSGTVMLVDAGTGEILISATEIDAGGGGWVLGGLIGAATRDDPATELRQMSAEFVDRVRVLIFGI